MFNYFTYRLCCLMLLVAMLLFSSTISSVQAASLSIIQSDSTSYIAQGGSLDGVAGIMMVITYDISSLSNSSVSQGSAINGALMSSNNAAAGVIRIAAISTTPFRSSGTVAQINFGARNGTGGITSVKCDMIDSKGSPVASQTTFSNFDTSVIASSPSATATSGTSVPAGSTTTPTTTYTQGSAESPSPLATHGMPTYLGQVSMPSDTPTQPEAKSVETSGVPLQDSELPQPIARTADPLKTPERVPVAETPDVARSFTAYTGVIDRFKNYTGEQTLEIFSALFKKDVADIIRQEPSVVLSDGKTPVNLTVVLNFQSSSSPNFALSGAKLVSMKRGDNNKIWIIKVLPNENVLKATLTVITDTRSIEYHLTIAPPVSASEKLNETSLKQFFKEVGTAEVPLHDLNKDGIRDYMDTFIFVVNYLDSIAKEKAALPKAKE